MGYHGGCWLRFYGPLLNRLNWSLPSEPKLRKYLRALLYIQADCQCGMECQYELFHQQSESRFHIALAYSSEALSTPYAHTSGFGTIRLKKSRKILNALQQNPEQVKDESMLAMGRIEKYLHQISFGSERVVISGK